MNDHLQIPENLPDWVKEHIELYLRDGEAGHFWDSSSAGGNKQYTTLLLITTGRSSGKKIVLPLVYQPTPDGNYCIIASKAGSPSHPHWYLNLLANPEVEVQVGNDRFKAVAEVVEEAERRNALWAMMADYFTPYKKYQTSTERLIPVVVLRRN